MLVQDIAKLARLLSQFLDHFVDCFARPAGRELLAVYVRGLLSDVQRKNVEAMALAQDVAPGRYNDFSSRSRGTSSCCAIAASD